MRSITKYLLTFWAALLISSYFYGRALPIHLNMDKVSMLGYNSGIGCLNLDIMLVGDFSYSVEGAEEFIADAFDAFIDRIELDRNSGTMIGILLFGDYPVLMSELTDDKVKLKNATRDIRMLSAGDYTEYTPALKMAVSELARGGRSEMQDMIILISDGNPTDVDWHLSKYLETMNDVLMCGVLITIDAYDSRYMASILLPECYAESDYNSLAFELERLDICL